VKSPGSTGELRSKLDDLSKIEVCGTSGGAVKCVDIGRNTSSESGTLGLN
jgi:hypothetical protein